MSEYVDEAVRRAKLPLRVSCVFIDPDPEIVVDDMSTGRGFSSDDLNWITKQYVWLRDAMMRMQTP